MREELGKKAVQFSKVGEIRHEHCGIYDQMESTASSSKNGIKIHKRLPRLNLEAGTARFAAGRVHAWLTGDEQQSRCTYRLGIRPDRLQSRDLNCLSVWHGDLPSRVKEAGLIVCNLSGMVVIHESLLCDGNGSLRPA